MASWRTKPSSGETRIVIAYLIAGFVARLAWTFLGEGLKPINGESHNIALSLVRFGRFADPNADGSGPSAHVGMLTPLPSALAYRLFGIDTRIAEFMLSMWAAGLVMLSLWLCWRLSVALGAPPLARVGAVLFAALVPLQFGLEVRDGRSWEVNLATVLLVWLLLRLVRADGDDKPAPRSLIVTGTLAGFLFIVSPPAGLAGAIAIGVFSFLCLPFRQWWRAPLAFVLVAGLLSGFWAQRNLSALGEPVLLRDNFGLELALSNYSGALDPADPAAAYRARQAAIHPHALGEGAERMQQSGGELSYYHDLGREAQRWIAQHPGDFLRLSSRHLVEFFLPPGWFWTTFTMEAHLPELRQLLVWLITLAGLASLAAMAWKKRAYAYVLIVTLTASLPYIVVQPTLRYRYLVSSLLIFAACDGTVRLSNYLQDRVRSRRDILIQESDV
ncbi:MAG TPA: hypothetical protein VN723_08055 [Rhizomicrobium sp.]|jgi:hypothetical protein|nr:hypothetical protein [Rhizomicrobium sp.]